MAALSDRPYNVIPDHLPSVQERGTLEDHPFFPYWLFSKLYRVRIPLFKYMHVRKVKLDMIAYVVTGVPLPL